MAADAWAIQNNCIIDIVNGTIDLTAGAGYFAVVLLDSGYTYDADHDTYSDISGDEVANGAGYTTGGDIIANPTATNNAGTVTFDSDDPSWTADGGAITARFAALVHVAAGSSVPQAGDKVMAITLLNDTPADETASDGNPFTIQLPAEGYFQIAEAA